MNSCQICTMLVCLIFLSGCSADWAGSRKDEPNLGLVHVGATIEAVEMALGSPEKSVVFSEGCRMNSYKYDRGEKADVPSAVKDTFCLVPSASVQTIMGDRYQILIIFGEDDRVVAISHSTPTTTRTAEKQQTEEQAEAYEEPADGE